MEDVGGGVGDTPGIIVIVVLSGSGDRVGIAFEIIGAH